jgi:hypothetical protein
MLCRSVHNYIPFVVVSTSCGESGPIYGGVHMLGGYGEKYFFQHGCKCDLRIGSPSP